MSDKFSFEYKDERNDIRIKMTLTVVNLMVDKKSKLTMDQINFNPEFWIKGKYYDKEQFAKAFTDLKDYKEDYGLGGDFGYFCAAVSQKLQALSPKSNIGAIN